MPDIRIAIRIYLIVAVVICTAERERFCRQSQLKTRTELRYYAIYYDYTDPLASTTILPTENDLMENLHFKQALKDFALEKARKKKTFV